MVVKTSPWNILGDLDFLGIMKGLSYHHSKQLCQVRHSQGVKWSFLGYTVSLLSTSLNTLSPNSDQYQISPGNISAYSTPEVMRIKDMITQGAFTWNFNNRLPSTFIRKVWGQDQRISFLILGVKGLKLEVKSHIHSCTQNRGYLNLVSTMQLKMVTKILFVCVLKRNRLWLEFLPCSLYTTLGTWFVISHIKSQDCPMKFTNCP